MCLSVPDRSFSVFFFGGRCFFPLPVTLCECQGSKKKKKKNAAIQSGLRKCTNLCGYHLFCMVVVIDYDCSLEQIKHLTSSQNAYSLFQAGIRIARSPLEYRIAPY